jgi:hypothetical protein
MKRVALIATLVAAGLGGAGTAQASCRTVGCLGRQVKSLKTQLTKVEKALTVLTTCLGEVPVTRFGDPTNHTFGYAYSPGTGGSPYYTTALDGTATGQNVSAWILFDRCNSKTTAAADLSSSGPAASPAGLRAPARDGAALSPSGPLAPAFSLAILPF